MSYWKSDAYGYGYILPPGLFDSKDETLSSETCGYWTIKSYWNIKTTKMILSQTSFWNLKLVIP